MQHHVKDGVKLPQWRTYGVQNPTHVPSHQSEKHSSNALHGCPQALRGMQVLAGPQ